MSIKRIIIERAREPSTWAAVAALGALLLPPEAADGWGSICAGAAGLLGALLPERRA